MHPVPYRVLTALAAAACIGFGAGRPGAEPASSAEYSVRVIEEPEGRIFRSPSRIEDLNDRGTVILWSQLQNQRQAGFLWKNGRLRDLGALGGKQAWPHALNNREQVAGEAQLADGTMHGFLWEDGKMRDLGAEPGLHSRAWDVSDRGVVVGAVEHPKTKESHAVRWAGGKLERLKDFGRSSSAQFINDRGEIAGYGQAAGGGYWHGFFWKGGRVKDLGVFSGWETSFFSDFNARGEAVGGLSRGGNIHTAGENLPVKTVGEELREIPALAARGIQPAAINDEGWILGTAHTGHLNESAAYLLREGRIEAVEELIRGSGWRITGVAALNNRGEIAVYGKRGDETRGLLLSPPLKLSRSYRQAR